VIQKDSTIGPIAIAGISFFLKNAVMFDMSNRTIGYTPFFVAVDNFNGLSVSQAMGPLGVAGVISGSNGVAIQTGASAYLTAANTCTGVTTVAKDGWLGVGGPGSIANSSSVNVNVNGFLDLFHSNGGQAIRSLSGGGNVILGPTTLELTAASGTFSGSINNVYPAGTDPKTTPSLFRSLHRSEMAASSSPAGRRRFPATIITLVRPGLAKPAG
jgi:hypothetical protein